MAGYDMSRLQIMIVDDDMLMRNLIKSMLRSLDITRVGTANDGQGALNELQVFTPDILLVDWEMKPMSGMDLTKRIRNMPDPYMSHLPIIMLTGYSQRERVFAARDVGVNDFLAKPLSVKRLYNRLLTVVKKPRDFVRTKDYFGPDRRRREDPDYKGPERRKNADQLTG